MSKSSGSISFLVRFTAFSLFTVAVFLLGKHWSDSYQQILSLARDSRLIAVGSISFSADSTVDDGAGGIHPQFLLPETIGLIDDYGKMNDDFGVGEYDGGEKEEEDEFEEEPPEKEVPLKNGDGGKAKVGKFPTCPGNMSDYVPCLDGRTVASTPSKLLETTSRRSCPSEDKLPNCLIPTPANYRTPIPWPASRNEVWYDNVPHIGTLKEYMAGGKKLLTRDGDKLRFSRGGTEFGDGIGTYLDQIDKMVPDIGFGSRTRLVLDIGCEGTASFGIPLGSRNVTTLSIAPKDGPCGSQVQLALEHGTPAMLAGLGEQRLLYPSQAFELIHCANCEVNWTRDDVILLLEMNRMLRAGGYFVCAAEPVYKEELVPQWKREGQIAIWHKTQNNDCYLNPEADRTRPPLCNDDDPDDVWDVNIKACIFRLPENGIGSGGNTSRWPERLHTPSNRLWNIKMAAYTSRRELFEAEYNYWSEIAGGYIRIFRWARRSHRNILDMRAGFGGFAAFVEDAKIDSWVMNVVPITEPNTLSVIYDRGLIGVIHDWCEPFGTYPRTYDIINAAGLFSKEQKRCNVSSIMLEVDRILRPGGRVYIRDTKQVLEVVEQYAEAIGWRVSMFDASTGPYSSRKLLLCEKRR